MHTAVSSELSCDFLDTWLAIQPTTCLQEKPSLLFNWVKQDLGQQIYFKFNYICIQCKWDKVLVCFINCDQIFVRKEMNRRKDSVRMKPAGYLVTKTAQHESQVLPNKIQNSIFYAGLIVNVISSGQVTKSWSPRLRKGNLWEQF